MSAIQKLSTRFTTILRVLTSAYETVTGKDFLIASLTASTVALTILSVFFSSNNNFLFLAETKKSVENEISETEIKKAVNNLNEIYKYYKNKGFDEVYISIIPNPVSIIEPECQKYNNLIPLIQKDNDVKMPFIDIYSIFKKTKWNVYYRSDSHWNTNGSQLWINELNRILSNTKSNNVLMAP